MSISLFFLVSGLWLTVLLKDPWLMAGFGGIWLVVLLVRIRRRLVAGIWILFWVVAAFMTCGGSLEPVPGMYRVCEVRSNYVIAESAGSRILFQEEDAGIHDEIEIMELEPLEGLKNIGLFDFTAYMQENGVRYRGSGRLVRRSDSLQGQIMSWCRSSPAKLSAFYGIREQETILDRAGLPVLGFLMVTESLLRRRLSTEIIRRLLIPFAIVWGWLFLWPVALMRWVLFRLFRLFDIDRLRAWSLSVLFFLVLMPEKAGSLSLVLPALLQLCSIVRRPAFARCLIVFLQVLYFRSVSLSAAGGYWLLKLLSAASFVLAWFDLQLAPAWDLPGIQLYPAAVLMAAGAFFLIRGLLRQKMSPVFWLCLMLMVCRPQLDPFFHVYLLDVGQGDCTVIVEPFGRSAVMIDAAGNLYRDNAETIILPFLESIGVKQQDALIVSHEDFDHSGAVEEVCRRVQVREVIRDGAQPVPVSYPFEHLLPAREVADENEGSLLSYFSYDGFSYLWPGDAGTMTETQLMETFRQLPVTVLKAGHHGSDTASSPAFLDWLDPDAVLISAGRHNRYGHPSPSVISSLQSRNISRFSTAENGMIHLFSWHGFLFLETAGGQVTRLA